MDINLFMLLFMFPNICNGRNETAAVTSTELVNGFNETRLISMDGSVTDMYRRMMITDNKTLNFTDETFSTTEEILTNSSNSNKQILPKSEDRSMALNDIKERFKNSSTVPKTPRISPQDVIKLMAEAAGSDNIFKILLQIPSFLVNYNVDGSLNNASTDDESDSSTNNENSMETSEENTDSKKLPKSPDATFTLKTTGSKKTTESIHNATLPVSEVNGNVSADGGMSKCPYKGIYFIIAVPLFWNLLV